MPYSYDTLLDITFASFDFLAGALTMPVRALFPNVPGIQNSGTQGDWEGTRDAKLDGYGIWVWVAIFALVVIYL